MATSAYSLDPEEIGKTLHDQIVDTFPKYKRQVGLKALAGCINWYATTPTTANAQQRFVSGWGKAPGFARSCAKAALLTTDLPDR